MYAEGIITIFERVIFLYPPPAYFVPFSTSVILYAPHRFEEEENTTSDSLACAPQRFIDDYSSALCAWKKI